MFLPEWREFPSAALQEKKFQSVEKTAHSRIAAEHNIAITVRGLFNPP